MNILALTLELTVPLRMAELKRRGGPLEADWDAARTFGPVLSERGDVLLYGGKPGQAAGLFNRLAEAIAVMAFLPGGITVFGTTWRAGE
jgi:hypothetical protein